MVMLTFSTMRIIELRRVNETPIVTEVFNMRLINR